MTPAPRPTRFAPQLAVALGLALAAALTPSEARADIYSWTDADGVQHFENKPNNPNAKLVVKASAPRNVARAGVTAVAPQDRDPSRYTRYEEWMRQAATLYQIPMELVRAVVKVESDYDPRAVSVAGARGLMQLMPETAERLLVRDINDPRDNIFGGVRYLRILANMFHGDLELTVAAYNAGEDAVMRHGGIPPFAQTRDYVVRVTKYYRRYRTTTDVVTASVTPLD